MAYGVALKSAIRARGKSQRQVARAVNVSEPHLSLILAGQRLPRADVAEALVTFLGVPDGPLPGLYRSAIDDLAPGPPSAEPLPDDLRDLLRTMRRLADELPYAQPGQHRISLSTVYVRQSVASPFEIRRNPDPELDEAAMADEDRRIFALAQQFDEVFAQHEHLVIEGTAGLGKSTLGRHLVGELTDKLLTGRAHSVDRLVPVMVPARTLVAHLDGRGWAEALRESVAAECGSLGASVPPAEVFASPVGDARWLVIVDALDEIPEPADREKLLKVLGVRTSAPGAARFLVTTRPLSPGEVEQLKDPRVGFFELQPFDRQALEQFAERRFDPHGTTEGALARAEFLDQVDAAGLEQVLVVPLLASVAAQVFEARRGRPLPASRYELYEEYIAQFATARDASAGVVFAGLCGPELIAWLDAHRIDLLERLAVEHVGSEMPLLGVARRFLADRAAPLPARLPVGWDGLLGDWLSRTGVLGRQGVRLRFLHQTFAEHLAATAEARDLPHPFDPADPVWAERITRFLLDDENAERVLLHHLHLYPIGAGPIAHLQRRSQAERERAGALITQGAPCTDAELDAYLTVVERQTLAGLWTDFRPLAALTRRPAVRDRLLALIRDGRIDDLVKVTIVDVLRDRCADARFEGVALLRAMVENVRRPPPLRCAAAEVLVRLGAEHRPAVVHLLRDLADDVDLPAGQRRQAAQALATLGGEHRDEAGRLLLALAESPGTEAWERQQAAEELATLGGEHRAQAADLLFRFAIDPAVGAYYRQAAAQSLARLGGDCRARAASALHRLGADMFGADGAQRLLAQAAALAMEPSGLHQATDLLYLVAGNPMSASQLSAIAELADLGGDHRARAARLYRGVALNPAVEPHHRRTAASDLAKLGPRHRDLAIETLTTVAGDPTLFPSYRLDAAEALARLGPTHRATTAHVLHEIATSPTAHLPARLRAATEWAKLGSPQRDRVRALFRSDLDDPCAPPATRILAGIVLASLDPDRQSPITAALLRLAVPAIGDDEARLLAANALTGLGGDALEAAVDILDSVAADPTREPQTRLDAIEQLIGLGGAHLERAATAMCALVDDLGPDDEALSNAVYSITRLAELEGGPYRAWASAALHRLATDPVMDPIDRYVAADRLAEFGQSHAVRAIEGLHALAADPTVWPSTRGYAASDFARLDQDRPDRVGALLEELILDPAASADDRCDTARDLAKLGGAGQKRAARALRRCTEVDGVRGHDRAMVLAHADAIDAGTDGPIVAALDTLAGDPDADLGRRLDAAQTLASLSTDRLDRILQTYRAIGTGLRPLPWQWQRAARELAKLDGPDRAQAAMIYLNVALDPTADAAMRLRAAVEWAKLGQGREDELTRWLRALAGAPGADADDRTNAALQLAEHDPRSAAEILAEIAADPLHAVDDRIEAARQRARFGGAQVAAILNGIDTVLPDRHAAPTDRAVAAALSCRLRPDSWAASAALLSGLLAAPGAGDRLVIARALLGLGTPGMPDAVDALARIVADPAENDAARIDAARQWARLGTAERPRAVAAIRALAADPAVDPDARTDAAVELAKRGEREEAVRVLLRLGGTHTVDAVCRIRALTKVGRLRPPGDRAEPVVLLLAIAADPAADLYARCDAAAEAARHGAGERQQAAEILIRIAAEPHLDPPDRQQVAEAITALGGEYRATGLDLLLRTIAEPGVAVADGGDTGDSALLLAAAAAIDPDLRSSAVEALRRAAADHTEHAWLRLAAARELADLGGERTGHAGRHLRALAEDGTADPDDRRDAAWGLLRYPTVPRQWIPELLSGLAVDESIDVPERILSAQRLADLGPDGVTNAAGLLGAIVGDPTLPAPCRLDAAKVLARFGSPARAEVTDVLTAMATDGGADTWDRLWALDLLSRLGPAARQVTAQVLPLLAAEPAAAGLPQALAYATLTGIDQRHHLRAVELLTAVATAHADRTGWERLQAVHILQRLSADHAERAAALLRTIAVDTDLRVWSRRQAAELLARHGPASRAQAATLLACLATEPDADPWERAEAASALAELDPDGQPSAIATLLDLINDPKTPADQTRHAAHLLLPFGTAAPGGPPRRAAAVGSLHRIAGNGELDPHERRKAALALVGFGSSAGASAPDLLARLAADPNIPPLQQALARADLAASRPAGRLPAAKALLAVGRDASEPANHRRRAAEALARLANATRADGAALLRTLALDAVSDPYERAMACHALARWDAAHRRTAATRLRGLDDTYLDSGQQRRAAEALAARCPDHRPDAARRLRMLATNPANSPSERRRAAAALARILRRPGRVVALTAELDP